MQMSFLGRDRIVKQPECIQYTRLRIDRQRSQKFKCEAYIIHAQGRQRKYQEHSVSNRYSPFHTQKQNHDP